MSSLRDWSESELAPSAKSAGLNCFGPAGLGSWESYSAEHLVGPSSRGSVMRTLRE